MKRVYKEGGIYIPVLDARGEDVTLALYPSGKLSILAGDARSYALRGSVVIIPAEAFAVVYEVLTETYFTGEE